VVTGARGEQTYEDAGHGGIFQNHVDFVAKALSFLDA